MGACEGLLIMSFGGWCGSYDRSNGNCCLSKHDWAVSKVFIECASMRSWVFACSKRGKVPEIRRIRAKWIVKTEQVFLWQFRSPEFSMVQPN